MASSYPMESMSLQLSHQCINRYRVMIIMSIVRLQCAKEPFAFSKQLWAFSIFFRPLEVFKIKKPVSCFLGVSQVMVSF